MKKYFILFTLFTIAFASCKKDVDKFDPAKQAAEDDAAIQLYLTTNGITAEKDPSGLYYQVQAPGFDASPSPTSAIRVNYTGKILSGEEFDKGANVTIRLNNTIDGWKIGIPKIKKGGRILLFVPSALAYGRNAAEKIPANSVLVFDVTLIDFSE